MSDSMQKRDFYRVLELPGPGEDFRMGMRPLVEPGAGQVRIRVTAAGLNRRDFWIWSGKYANIQYPAVLGSDACGVVEAVGEGVATALRGLRVVVNPSLHWGGNEAAAGPDWRILGMPDEGALAECLTLPAEQVHIAPEHLNDAEAAALPLAGLTGWRALFSRGGLQAGEKVLLTGIGGGVSQWMLVMALAAGAKVWVTSGKAERIERAVLAGAQDGVNYRDTDWEKSLLKQCPGGFDLIVDSAGGPDFSRLIDVARAGGRLVFFGATQGNVPELPLRKIFWRQIDLRGTTMGSPRDFAAMLKWVSSCRLHPTLEPVLPITETTQAMRRFEAGELFGKQVLKIAFG